MTQFAGNMQSYPAQYNPSNPVNNPQGTGSIGNNNYLLSFNFPHTTSSIEFKLAQPASQGAADEAWYFDNFNLELFECGAGGATIWSTGQGGDSIWVKPTQTTTYWVKRWMQGIECSDTIRVHVSNLQQTFNPFTDTIIVCDTNAVQLNVGAGYTAYSWSDGSTDSTKTVLSTGYQFITVTDSLGCQATDSVWIYFSDLTAFLSKNNDVSCFGGSNGSIALTASGGQPPYAITWSTGQTGINSLTNLGAGVYWVTVTDALGCSRGDTVAVGQPTAPLGVNLAVLNVSCFGGNNGSVISVVSGGTAPYTYNWNTNPVQSGSSVNGLAAGSYTLTITDANGCFLVANATVTEPAAPLTASVSGSNVGCFGATTGSASVVASGGISPYSYSWNTVPVQTTAAAVGLSSGTYSVTVTDANGCTSAQSITITQPSAPLSASVIATSVNCFGGTNGTASAIPSGGTGPYSFIWNTMPAQTGQTATNLAAGTYTVIVTDANNCSTTQSVSVTQPIGPLVLVPTSIPVACFGDATGSAGVLVSGGTAPYAYQWPSLPGITANSANNLSAGTYTVIVTDAKGCVQQTSVVVTQPSAPLSGTATVTNVNCYGDVTGSISISMVGGTSPYTFNWSSLPGFSSANATNLTAGTYTVTATDANGCTFPLNVTVTQPSAPLMVATSGTDALCFGEASGSAQVAATGGTAPYSYSWNSNPAQNTAAATGLLAGTYTVIVTDANGCSEAAVWTVNQPMPLMATEVINDVSCRGAQDGSIQLSISGGTGAYYVLWPNGMTSPNRYQLGPGTYSYTVRDENNCTFIGTAIVDEPEPFKVQVDTTSPKCISTEDGAITVSASGGNGGLTYYINGELFNGMASGLGVFPYSIQIVDQNGCDTSFVVDLEPVYEPCVEIPNWFSPNSNGANDLWIIQGFELEQLNLIVFNVFGQIVYETNSDNYVPWDGTYLGEPLPNGDYYYVMTSKDERKYYSGYVTILR
jgi:gliding motility-associated-like protein